MNQSDCVLGKGAGGFIGWYPVAGPLARRFQQVHKVDLKPLSDRFQIAFSFYFFASAACVCAVGKQRDPNVTALQESDAYPAEAEDGYGWEKLFSERMCRHFREDYGLETRVARYHNVYGPNGTDEGAREKAPAAICRKVIEAKRRAGTRSRSGATASRPEASWTSTTVLRARSRSCNPAYTSR
jgi:NAD dependent epimerase/dehydratase family